MLNNRMRQTAAMLLSALLLVILSACTSSGPKDGGAEPAPTVAATEGNKAVDNNSQGEAAAFSYTVDEQPGEVFYEIFVRAFYDTDGDGIGDLNGVTAKLDYLKEMGIGGIWLMPINSSPSYHGYDTTDYYAINPEYGTMDDFKNLLEEAHKRGIKIVMDLVVNHSSSEHPWFKDAASNADSPYRNWYTFLPADADARSDNAAGSGSPWHNSGTSKYLGIFWGGMPDFNFDEPQVREEMIKIGQYWLELGVDGFRLDAAKHIYGDFSSTVKTKEVQAANKDWWQEFRSGLNEVNPDAYLIGEVWDSTAVIGPYLDKALDSAFNFDLAGRLLGAASGESDPDLGYSLGRVHTFYEKSSGGAFLDAPFLANHDQNRVMTVLNGNIDHAKMAAAMLLTLPGTPYLYYGEEIGMKGAKPDEYIREPMLWYADPAGGEGQTTWESSRHNTGKDAVSVEAQDQDEQSLLNHYRKLISWRNAEPELQNGAIGEYKLDATNRKLSVYVRVIKDDRVLVVHNFSGEQQQAELKPSSEFGSFNKLIHSTSDQALLEGEKLSLPPYSTVIIR